MSNIVEEVANVEMDEPMSTPPRESVREKNEPYSPFADDVDYSDDEDASAARRPRSREGENNSNHKIEEKQALEIWRKLQSGEKAPKCAEEFGVSVHIVRSIKYGKRWTHVTGLESKRKRGKRDVGSPSDYSPVSSPTQESPVSPTLWSTDSKRRKAMRRLLQDTEPGDRVETFLDNADETEVSVVELLAGRFGFISAPALCV